MDQTASVLFSHFTSAALVVWIIQKLKGSKYFPLLTEESQTIVKRLFSFAGAFGAHVGINWAWHAGGPLGGYQFVANIPPVTMILTAVWRWAGQFVAQEGWYQLIYSRSQQAEKVIAAVAEVKKLLPGIPPPTK